MRTNKLTETRVECARSPKRRRRRRRRRRRKEFVSLEKEGKKSWPVAISLSKRVPVPRAFGSKVSRLNTSITGRVMARLLGAEENHRRGFLNWRRDGFIPFYESLHSQNTRDRVNAANKSGRRRMSEDDGLLPAFRIARYSPVKTVPNVFRDTQPRRRLNYFNRVLRVSRFGYTSLYGKPPDFRV